MKKRLVAFTAVLMLAMPSQANAQSVVIGGGNADCQTLLDRELFFENQANMQWLFGYISGAASYSVSLNQGSPTDLSRNADLMRNDLVRFAKGYCEQDRSRRLYHAANKIITDVLAHE